MFSRTTTRSTSPRGAGTPGYVFAGRRFAYRSNSLRSATFTERKPLPSSVVRGPLRPTLLRRMDSRAAGGNGVPHFAIAGTPISWRSHSTFTPVASIARRVASTISGPVPSPGMRVILCVAITCSISGFAGDRLRQVGLAPRGKAARRSISFRLLRRLFRGLHRLVAGDGQIVTLRGGALLDRPAHDHAGGERLPARAELREEPAGQEGPRLAREE